MKNYYLLILLSVSIFSFAQIRGTITDDKGIPLSLVTVLEENTYNGTSSNEQGNYELNIKKTGKQSVKTFSTANFCCHRSPKTSLASDRNLWLAVHEGECRKTVIFWATASLIFVSVWITVAKTLAAKRR